MWYVKPSEPDDILFLEKLDFWVGNARFTHVNAGKPIAYTLRTTGIKFWPARDVAYTLNWSFYKHSADLSTNVANNEWLADDEGAPEALIG